MVSVTTEDTEVIINTSFILQDHSPCLLTFHILTMYHNYYYAIKKVCQITCSSFSNLGELRGHNPWCNAQSTVLCTGFFIARIIIAFSHNMLAMLCGHGHFLWTSPQEKCCFYQYLYGNQVKLLFLEKPPQFLPVTKNQLKKIHVINFSFEVRQKAFVLCFLTSPPGKLRRRVMVNPRIWKEQPSLLDRHRVYQSRGRVKHQVCGLPASKTFNNWSH